MTRCQCVLPWWLAGAGLLLLFGARSFESMAVGALAFGLAAGRASRNWLVPTVGVLTTGAILWLDRACGSPDSLAEAGVRLDATFDNFTAAAPLAGLMGCAALWLIVVPAGEALRCGPADRGRFIMLGCFVPVAGVAVARATLGGLVRDVGLGGWSIWQDVVAQLALPMGAVAAVGCGAGALAAARSHRIGHWAAASAGGLFLMGIGRANDGALSAATWLMVAQMVSLTIWFSAQHAPGGPNRLLMVVGAVAAASLAGIWPLPGGATRWRLLDEASRGGFGMAWDGLLLSAVVLTWALAVAAWLPWVPRAMRDWRSLGA